MYTIDNCQYHKKGEAKVTFGTGEDASTVSFEALEREDGKLVYLHKDDKVYRLYGPASPPDQSPGAVEETATPSSLKPFGEIAGNKPSFIWGKLTKPADEPGHFHQTEHGFFIRDEAGTRAFYNVTVAQDGPKAWVSPNLKAIDMPRKSLEVVQSSFAMDAASALFFAVGVFLLLSALGATNSAPLTLFWWFAGMLGLFRASKPRQSWGYLAAHLLGATYFIHFLTYGIDFEFALRTAPELALREEFIKILAILGGLVILRAAKKKLYSLVTDSAINAGTVSFWLWVVAIGVYSLIDEYNHYAWFVEYAGSLPWSLLWPLIWVICWMSTAEDYAKVPLTFRGFSVLLQRLIDGLSGPWPEVAERTEMLQRYADDLEDSLRLSDDPRLRPFMNFGDQFLKVRDTLTQLSLLDKSELPPQVQDQVQQDLDVLVDDLKFFQQQTNTHHKSAQLFTLRLSPYLRCLEP